MKPWAQREGWVGGSEGRFQYTEVFSILNTFWSRRGGKSYKTWTGLDSTLDLDWTGLDSTLHGLDWGLKYYELKKLSCWPQTFSSITKPIARYLYCPLFVGVVGRLACVLSSPHLCRSKLKRRASTWGSVVIFVQD